MRRRWWTSLIGGLGLLWLLAPAGAAPAEDGADHYFIRAFGCYLPIPIDFVLDTQSGSGLAFYRRDPLQPGQIAMTSPLEDLGEGARVVEREALEGFTLLVWEIDTATGTQRVEVFHDAEDAILLMDLPPGYARSMIESCAATREEVKKPVD